jgi:type I restriction enzyme M protein
LFVKIFYHEKGARLYSHPACYVDFEETEGEGEGFGEKMDRLTAELSEQFRKSKEPEMKIQENMVGLRYEL